MLFVRGVYVAAAGAGAGQRMARPYLGRENHRCAVAVVDVTIHGHGAGDLALMVHALDGHRHIVNHAEALAMVRMRVMKSAADIAGYAIAQRQIGGKNRSPGRQPERLHQLRRVRHLHLQFFLRGERSGLELLHVFARVHQQDVFIQRRLGCDEVLRLRQPAFQQPLVDQPVFCAGKNMRADGQVVVVGINSLKGSAIPDKGNASPLLPQSPGPARICVRDCRHWQFSPPRLNILGYFWSEVHRGPRHVTRNIHPDSRHHQSGWDCLRPDRCVWNAEGKAARRHDRTLSGHHRPHQRHRLRLSLRPPSAFA